MLQSCKVAAFTVFDLLRENQLPVGGDYAPSTQIRVNKSYGKFSVNICSDLVKHQNLS